MSRFRRTRLTSIASRPALWGGLYLALIPGFGAWYATMPRGSFYDANLRREQAIIVDLGRIRTGLSEAVEDGVSETPYRGPDGCARSLVRRTVRVTQLRLRRNRQIATNPEIVLAVSAEARNCGLLEESGPSGQHNERGRDLIDFQAAFFLEAGAGARMPTGQEVAVFNILPYPNSPAYRRDVGLDGPPFGLFWTRDRPVVRRNDTLVVPLTVLRLLQRYVLTPTGDPTAASGAFLRMTYFSAVAATTTGFGDISPVSRLARGAVTLESVLGVVMIGLFLNGLARAAGLRRRRDAD